jgi:hypothetical protein
MVAVPGSRLSAGIGKDPARKRRRIVGCIATSVPTARGSGNLADFDPIWQAEAR